MGKMTASETDEEVPAPGRAARFRSCLHRVSHRCHRLESYSHLAYFAMMVTHLDYKLAAGFCLLFGTVALMGGEEA